MSSAIFFLQLSYAVPLLLLLYRGEAALAEHADGKRAFSLGKWRRPVNIAALIFLAITSVVFLFPPFLPVTAESMNYAVVVFLIVLVMCAVAWVVDGKENFSGPTEVEERLVEAKSA